jgi:hypothetical protein
MGLWRRLFLCRACQVLEAEVARCGEREERYLQEIRYLSDKISAYADVQAHVAAVRAQPPTEEEQEERKRRPRAAKLVPWINRLAGGGHFKPNMARAAVVPKVGLKVPPPAKDPIPGA